MANPLASEDFSRLILDANVMVSALMGRSFLLLLFEEGVELMAPVQQIAETRHILSKRGFSPSWIDGQMAELAVVVMPIHPAVLGKHAVKACSRLGPRGQPDWPVLAATYAAGATAWSDDRNLFGSGAPVWSTRILMREMNYSPPARVTEERDA